MLVDFTHYSPGPLQVQVPVGQATALIDSCAAVLVPVILGDVYAESQFTGLLLNATQTRNADIDYPVHPPHTWNGELGGVLAGTKTHYES